jgi:hypothetical protein
MSTILKRHSRGIFAASQGGTVQIKSTEIRLFSGHQARVHSDQRVLVMARREAGPCERWPKTLKGKLKNNSRKPRDLVGNLA